MSCQVYASALLAETRTSKELNIILNHDQENITDFVSEKKMSLSRLKLAIKYRQKKVSGQHMIHGFKWCREQ